MPSINLRDKRNRDALVRADSVGQSANVHFVDKDGANVRLRKVLKATSEHSFGRLLRDAGDETKLAEALLAGDVDCDMERIGMFLTETSRVFVNDKGEIAYQIEQIEIVRSATGEEKERRPRRQPEPNVDSEIPISWTGRLVKKEDAARRFVFSGKLQIVHVNGLTYDFLYGMAKELAEANSLMLLGAGKSGKDPLIFRRGSTPHRGFLEGRIQGDKYVLLLHLSKLELKAPVVVEVAAVAQPAAQAAAAAPVAAPAAVPAPAEPVVPAPVVAPAAEPVPEPVAAARKPTVAEVLAATTGPAEPTTSAKDELAAPVEAAKTTKRRKSADAVAAKTTPDGEAPAVKAPAKPRAKKPKPEAGTSST
jgi:pyruvate/2-oxoglutarate dehydrogenase complex dihydrolipoamide acyltransferase (E2) component